MGDLPLCTLPARKRTTNTSSLMSGNGKRNSIGLAMLLKTFQSLQNMECSLTDKQSRNGSATSNYLVKF